MATRDAYRAAKSALTRGRPRKTWTARRTARLSTRNFATSSLKHHQETVGANTRKTHKLYDEVLSAITQSTGSIHNRERQQIFIKGVKLTHYAQILNPIDTTNGPLETWEAPVLRLIVAQNRYRDTDYAEATTDADLDLFKGFASTSATNFTDHSNGLLSMSLPINRNKWNVFYDRKFTFSVRSDHHAMSRLIDTYIPINKKFQYTGTSSTSGTNPLVLLWYYETPFGSAAGASAVDVMKDRSIAKVYFEDIV